jgi:hypothetical protein
MARKSRTARTYFAYNREELDAKIEKFNAYRTGNTVSTEYDGRGMDVKVSDLYRFFDFKTFARNVIALIESNTQIFYYALRIRKGIQEISILTNPIQVGEDLYYQNLFLLNSNDRSRALQFNAGLLRWKDDLGFVVPVPNANTSERAIHKGNLFEEKVKGINSFVDTLPTLMDRQMEIIERTGHKEASLKSIINTLLAERPVGATEVTATALNRAKSFMFRMLESIGYNTLDQLGLVSHINLLKQPLNFVKSDVDAKVNLYEAFIWYTSIYKNRDSAIISRESNRFFKLMESFEISEVQQQEEQELEFV